MFHNNLYYITQDPSKETVKEQKGTEKGTEKGTDRLPTGQPEQQKEQNGTAKGTAKGTKAPQAFLFRREGTASQERERQRNGVPENPEPKGKQGVPPGIVSSLLH